MKGDQCIYLLSYPGIEPWAGRMLVKRPNHTDTQGPYDNIFSRGTREAAYCTILKSIRNVRT